MYSVTIFKNQYDNKTHRRLDFETWIQFERFIYKLSERPMEGKKDAELISPAVYQDGTTRSNKNVLGWAGWAAVDVDDHEFSGNLKDELIRTYGKYNFICYSTASSKDGFPKFRLVFPITKTVKRDSIKHFWFALNSELDSIGDKQTKDLSRKYYVPATYNDAFNFIFTNSGGNDINPHYLMSKWEYSVQKDSKNFMDRLPEEWQKQIIEYRKGKMNNDITYSSYADCPFVNKKLIDEFKSIAHIDNSGRYAMIYKIMVSIASNAISRQYPITAQEIETLCRQIDLETGNRYENRPLNVEANNALEYAYKNGVIS
jgi:hypothetical protein